MKYIIKSNICFLLVTFLLSSCIDVEKTYNYIGIIVKKNDTQVLVVGKQKNQSNFEAIWVTVTDSSLKIGLEVGINFEGSVATSFPGKGKAKDVTILRGNKEKGALQERAVVLEEALLTVSDWDVPAISNVIFDVKKKEWLVVIEDLKSRKKIVLLLMM